jgi:hypothetical protein
MVSPPLPITRPTKLGGQSTVAVVADAGSLRSATTFSSSLRARRFSSAASDSAPSETLFSFPTISSLSSFGELSLSFGESIGEGVSLGDGESIAFASSLSRSRSFVAAGSAGAAMFGALFFRGFFFGDSLGTVTQSRATRFGSRFDGSALNDCTV